MGASGAGKTTLLNVLAARIALGGKKSLEGDVMMNDEIKVDQESFGKFGAYVMQDDILFEWFTVRETLTFTARLKLTKMTPK